MCVCVCMCARMYVRARARVCVCVFKIRMYSLGYLVFHQGRFYSFPLLFIFHGRNCTCIPIQTPVGFTVSASIKEGIVRASQYKLPRTRPYHIPAYNSARPSSGSFECTSASQSAQNWYPASGQYLMNVMTSSTQRTSAYIG